MKRLTFEDVLPVFVEVLLFKVDEELVLVIFEVEVLAKFAFERFWDNGLFVKLVLFKLL